MIRNHIPDISSTNGSKKPSTYTKQVEQSRRFQAKKQGIDFNGTEPAGNGTLFNGVAFEQRYGNYYATGWNAESCKVLRVAVLDALPKGWRVVVNGDTRYIYPTLTQALASASLYCK